MFLFEKVSGINICEEEWFFANKFFNEEDIYVNFKNFDSGKSHFVLITGFSGSGKSTLAKEIVKEYDAEYVEMDIFNFRLAKKPLTEDDLIEIGRKYPAIYKYIMTKHKKNINWIFDYISNEKIDNRNKRTFRENESNAFIDWLISSYKKKIVIEGVSVAVYITMNNKTRDYPIIFKGTSKYQSIYRMLNRENESKWDIIKKVISGSSELKLWYDMDEVSQNSARISTLQSSVGLIQRKRD